jgi:predicted dehydrogenase/sugar phosphate isomerase/epimerase
MTRPHFALGANVFLSIFTDEIGKDVSEALPVIRSWGLRHVDLRGKVFGGGIEFVPPERLGELRKLLEEHGLKVGCLQTSLAKVHLPDERRRQAEAAKLEGIVRAADALDCRLVRAFFYWQPRDETRGRLAELPDQQETVLEMFSPLARRARSAGLTMAFENCGAMPEEVFAILDRLGEPSWGLAWDVNNTWDCPRRLADEDAYIRVMAKRARLLHVKAGGAVKGYADHTIPYEKVLYVCAAAGVPGSVAVETHNPDPANFSDQEMSSRVVEVIRKAWPTAAPGGLGEEPEHRPTRPRQSWHDRPVGFVVVGLGMGHVRAKAVTESAGCKLLGVCDRIEERAKRSSEAYSVPCTLELAPWLSDDRVEVVYVMTETGNHAAVACQALDAGKHVLCTKPMEASVEACDRMIRLAESKGLLLGVDLDRRYDSQVLSLRAAIAAGRFGRVLSGNCSLKILRDMEYFHHNGAWRGTRKLDGGGVLSNQTIHHIDELAFCLGTPARVRCAVWTQNHAIEAEDYASATWLYENGAVINLFATTSYPQPTWYLHLELEGTRAAYCYAGGGPFEKPMARYYIDGAWTETPPDKAESEHLCAAENFAAALRTGCALTAPGRDGRRTRAILDAMYESANRGDWVNVKAEFE